MKNYTDILITIPTLNPPMELVDYVNDLNVAGFSKILIIDDGSDAKCKPVFKALADNHSCTILRHAVNLGKGRAIKDAINYYLNLSTDKKHIGIITVDSDGQHIAKDVISVAKEMCEHPDSLILGCRNFSRNASSEVPSKSLWGNRTTMIVFRLLFGKKIQDTQTGLRGIPEALMPDIIGLNGERFEYETNMLIYTVKHNIPIIETPIETVYMNNNEETHFRPIKDSFKIYGLMFATFFKYTITSLSSFVIDILLFQLFIILFQNMADSLRITSATVLARICSSLFNFFINKTIVFEQKDTSAAPYLLRYYCLCIAQMLLSAAGVSFIYKICPASEALIKIVIDTLLFFFSFRIQQAWVFRQK